MHVALCQCTWHCANVRGTVPTYISLCQYTWNCANTNGSVQMYVALCQYNDTVPNTLSPERWCTFGKNSFRVNLSCWLPNILLNSYQKAESSQFEHRASTAAFFRKTVSR